MYQPFEQIILHLAFNMVANPADWKAEIDATVEVPTMAEAAVICIAITHFTATIPRSQLVAETGNGFRIRYQSEGYRMGPAGDH